MAKNRARNRRGQFTKRRRATTRRRRNPAVVGYGRKRRATTRRRRRNAYFPKARRRRNMPVSYRRSRRRAPARRRTTRRRNPSALSFGRSLGLPKINFRNMLRPNVLLVGGGAVAAPFLSEFTWNQFLKKWVVDSQMGSGAAMAVAIGNQVLIPVGAAVALQRMNRPFAFGMAIGGISSGVSIAFNYIRARGMAAGNGNGNGNGNGEASGTEGSGAYFGGRGTALTPGYQATNQFSANGSIYSSQRAFPSDAWSAL